MSFQYSKKEREILTMPKYFRSHAAMLHAEAFASFLLIQLACAANVRNGQISDKLHRVLVNAESRVDRRGILLTRSDKGK